MNRFFVSVAIIAISLINSNLYSSGEYAIYGTIESVRKDGIITVLFQKKPTSNKYFIMHENERIGELNIEHINSRGSLFVAIAKYTLNREKFASTISAGMDIALFESNFFGTRDFTRPYFTETIRYKERVISHIDNREMLLIEEGHFHFGSNAGSNDESPQRRLFLGAFYMDKYEVSNADYYNFVNSASASPPLSWENGIYNSADGDLPVLATYHEAIVYAKWAGKRLPTEEEWEKAARGPAESRARTFPWTGAFNSNLANSLERWRGGQARLMPVQSLEEGKSHYGIVNLAGNVAEWTSSWYLPYEGNLTRNNNFGKRFKVVRGGSFYNNRDMLRVTSRTLGGYPNLHQDNKFGFRCVRDVMITDEVPQY